MWVKILEVRQEGPGNFKLAASRRAVDQDSGADLDPDNLLAQGAVAFISVHLNEQRFVRRAVDQESGTDLDPDNLLAQGKLTSTWRLMIWCLIITNGSCKAGCGSRQRR